MVRRNRSVISTGVLNTPRPAAVTSSLADSGFLPLVDSSAIDAGASPTVRSERNAATPQRSSDGDNARLVGRYSRACERGDGLACRKLASVYEGGKARDLARARVLFDKACSAGDLKGWLEVGRRFAGKGSESAGFCLQDGS